MPNKEITKKGEVGNLDYLKEIENTVDDGLGDMSSEDISLSRLKICQATSEITDEIDIELGQLYDSVMKTNFGDAVSFVPILFWKSKVWFSDEFKLIQSMRVAKDGSPILKTDVPLESLDFNDANDSYNYYIVLEDELIKSVNTGEIPIPMIWSTVRSANTPTKKMNSKISANASRGLPIFSQVIMMSTLKKKFNGGSAFVPVYAFGRYVNKKEAALLTEISKSVAELHEVGAPEHMDSEDTAGDFKVN